MSKFSIAGLPTKDDFQIPNAVVEETVRNAYIDAYNNWDGKSPEILVETDLPSGLLYRSQIMTINEMFIELRYMQKDIHINIMGDYLSIVLNISNQID